MSRFSMDMVKLWHCPWSGAGGRTVLRHITWLLFLTPIAIAGTAYYKFITCIRKSVCMTLKLYRDTRYEYYVIDVINYLYNLPCSHVHTVSMYVGYQIVCIWVIWVRFHKRVMSQHI
jgi:hypothetical protein